MKKLSLNLSIFFFLISFCIVVPARAATTPNLSISPGPTSSSNPGPPLGVPCGKTMCLANEICTSYPGETDQHCVPAPLPNPTLPDCEDVLGAGQGTFPPNIKCWNHFINAQTELSLYKKTCIYEPIASYGDKRKLNGGPTEQPFSMCGKGDSGPGGPPAPGGRDNACDIHMLVNTDVKAAQMGGYGPSASVSANYSIDFVSQNYLYNALFDRPLDLSDKNREAYRTYWRLMSSENQANLRSYVLNMADQKLINNIHFDFVDADGTKKTTDFVKLYNALKTQVTLFWHFPFVRIGCLASYPVCPEYPQAQRELKPVFEDMLLLADELNLSPLVSGPINVFRAAISVFGFDLNGPYEAFVPLEFDSVRGYIVKKKDSMEEDAYNKYPVLQKDLANGFDSFRLTNVSAENLPYIGAIYQGLLSPKFGMLPALQPQWIIDKYATPEADIISDYKVGNSPANLPEVQIAQKGFLERVEEETAGLLTDPFVWVAKKVASVFTSLFGPDNTKKIGYTPNKVDNTKNDIVDQYVNMQSCPMPVSYHLLSPETAAKSINEPPDDHHQIITIPGNQLEWEYTPKCEEIDNTCTPDPITGIPVCRTSCHEDEDTYIDDNRCCTREWSVSGMKHGKALTVLNNPKQTDIKKAVASEDKISLYKMLLPEGTTKIPNAEIDAPIAKHENTEGGGLITAPNGKGQVTNPAVSILRENNLAQDSVHYLQSCWTVPKDLQNSPRCKTVPAPVASSSACTGELFAKLAPNPDPPSSKGLDYFNTYIKSRITPELIEAYTAAQDATGIPCEVFAGIHFEEGDNDPTKSLQDGSFLNGKTLKESAIQAGQELLAKAGGAVSDLNTLIQAMSRYNGGGNSNCQPSNDCSYTADDRCGATVACATAIAACSCSNPIPEPGSCRDKCSGSFAWKFDYPYCPSASEGYDDPYVTNWWKSPEHDTMYLLYMRDCTQTKPQVHARPGSLTVAISLFLSEQSTK